MHTHTQLSLFLSAEILYLPPMTSLARGGGGRDQRTQPLLLHDFNVLNRHRKSRAHLKNTLRVLSFDVVTELFFPSWSHSCYTLTVFLESYSDESPPSFSPNSFALSSCQSVLPSAAPGPGRTLSRIRIALGQGRGGRATVCAGDARPGNGLGVGFSSAAILAPILH